MAGICNGEAIELDSILYQRLLRLRLFCRDITGVPGGGVSLKLFAWGWNILITKGMAMGMIDM